MLDLHLLFFGLYAELSENLFAVFPCICKDHFS